ncbi:MAG: ATP12 family protein [Cypionkella sp.]|nr:ATP12 family protein [Cypionkella sp.]
MTTWAAKRFWKTAQAVQLDAGYTVHLDGRAVKTPAKNPLILPTRALADLIAAEWDAQAVQIDPETMPMTRRANSALEKVAPNRAAVIDELAGYGASDLLCYRADSPAELAQRQALGWQPWLDWAARAFLAPLRVTTGVVPIDQPAASLAALRTEVEKFDAFGLAGLHDLVAISGSLVLALAMAKGALRPEAGFDLSRIDEAWQAEKWGMDDEASARESFKKTALIDAYNFLFSCA